jgi:hypothetical protein
LTSLKKSSRRRRRVHNSGISTLKVQKIALLI